MKIFIASVLGTAMLTSAASAAAAAKNYETNVEYGVNMRTGPSTSNKVVRMLRSGEDIHVIEADGYWLKVETENGQTGYISSNEKYTNYDPAAVRYETEVEYGVNFRSQPSTSGHIYRMLPKGEKIHVLERDGSWLKVRTKNGQTGYISAKEKYTDYEAGSGSSGSTSGSTSGSVGGSRAAVVATAKSYKGDFEYKWGAEPWNTSYRYADCSSYMELVFRRHGIDLPRTSRSQAKEGTYVKKSNLKAGDLVFFDTNDNGTINHVGMYIGDGEFIHASPSFDGVDVSKLSSNFWSDAYVTARSVL